MKDGQIIIPEIQSLSTQKKPAKILVIEDDADCCTLLSQVLTDEGFVVYNSPDGAKGYNAIAEFQPDLVLLDIMMPKFDGFELCRKIRANDKTKSLPLLILTAKDAITDKIKGFQSGSDDYITKPFVIGELLARINAHLRIQELKKELALSEERYRLLIENSPDGILLFSPQFELLFHNSKFIEILKGKTTEPITGRVLRSLFPISDLFAEISILLDKVVAMNGHVRRDVSITASNHGTIFLEMIGMPIQSSLARVEMFQVIVHNITQRRKMEDALIQAEKINSLGILTAGIAHEVNNPLTGISNAIQILKKADIPSQRREELCDLILNNIGRIVKIVKDLNIFSQSYGSSPQIFSIQEAVSETINLARYQVAGGQIEFEWNPSNESFLLFGDKNQFQQVMINLLVNAVQAINKKGIISIKLEKESKNVVIIVEDTGCGIPTDQLGRIFDPFFTTKRDWKGTGLGLAVSYRIIQLFKGTLTVRSTVGKGTRFLITLPLYHRAS